jgi:hypothetical protein
MHELVLCTCKSGWMSTGVLLFFGSGKMTRSYNSPLVRIFTSHLKRRWRRTGKIVRESNYPGSAGFWPVQSPKMQWFGTSLSVGKRPRESLAEGFQGMAQSRKGTSLTEPQKMFRHKNIQQPRVWPTSPSAHRSVLGDSTLYLGTL